MKKEVNKATKKATVRGRDLVPKKNIKGGVTNFLSLDGIKGESGDTQHKG